MVDPLIKKYNVSGPRYTSYPTVPHWNIQDFTLKQWKTNLLETYQNTNTSQGISVYIHLPYCESMCTFCGCNKRITKKHEVELPYINAVIKEWSMYLNLFDKKPRIQQIHIGGGTPTFFSPENIDYLLTCILNTSIVADHPEFSFEGHPNNTTKEHLEVFYEKGFRRVCFGVQDYNETVQKAINRIQPFEKVKEVTELARAIGYTSVGHDIIYGLPFQTEKDVQNTIAKTKELLPDRIAFYSYAHVPWIKGNGQRGFSEKDLPTAKEKMNMYLSGKKELEEIGYQSIGMDHFSVQSDSLFTAVENKNLHRNFMGYTTSSTKLMIGLGVSSIGDSWNSFYQNVKNIDEYQELVSKNIFPISKGHIHNEQELLLRQHILDLMCRYETTWNHLDAKDNKIEKLLINLYPLIRDGLALIENQKISVTELGKPFVRNICMAIDPYMQKDNTSQFSKTI